VEASPSFADLKRAAPRELEELYVRSGGVSVPKGVFRGRHLVWLDTPAAHDPVLRPVEELFFRRLPWFIDFDRKCWFWFGRRYRVGHFSPSVGPSRWRDAETIRMLYDDRHLPGFVNQWLYDEVKPIGDDVCLGMGGVSGRRGAGEQFFFALRRV
jgi:hypothetical protein